MIESCQQLKEPRFPTSLELQGMAIAMCQRFPVLQDVAAADKSRRWEGLWLKMKRRLANKKPVQKPQGPRDAKVHKVLLVKETHQDDQQTLNEEVFEEDSEQHGDIEQHKGSDDEDLMNQHYSKLIKIISQGKPNEKVVRKLLDMEFPQRRRFIVSHIATRDRQDVICKKYPCFLEAVHLVDEIRRCVQMDDQDYLANCAQRLSTLLDQLYLYGIKQDLFSPSAVEGTCDKQGLVLQHITQMFSARRITSKIVITLKNDADLHSALKKHKEPTIFATPSGLVVASNRQVFSLLATDRWVQAVLVVFGIHYTFLIPYSPGTQTTMSILQTLILNDEMHPEDETREFRRELLKFNQFVETDGNSYVQFKNQTDGNS